MLQLFPNFLTIFYSRHSHSGYNVSNSDMFLQFICVFFSFMHNQTELQL